MARVVVRTDGGAEVDVTHVVRQLWNTHQWCIDQGYSVEEDEHPTFEEFRAAAGLWTQEQYVMDKFDRFRKHTEWLVRMNRTNWGMTTEEGL